MRLGRIGFYDEAGFDTAAASGLEFLEICCNFDNEAEAFVAGRKLRQVQYRPYRH